MAPMTRPATDRWLILRCANCKTLELAASLCNAGFEAWAPAETIVLKPRRGNKRVEVRQPLMASFVFARADRLTDLLNLSHSPTLNYRIWDSGQRRMVTRGHPYFRVFRLFGEFRFVPDAHLAGLRKLDLQRRPKGKARPFAPGSQVRITEGGFEGLVGVVEECRGDYATVTIDDWGISPKVATWLLHPVLDDTRPVHVSPAATEQALSAKAA
jgi:transcription antitermination factor NusG